MSDKSDPAMNGNVRPLPMNGNARNKPGRALAWSDGMTLSRPLPPTPWLVRALQIAPGRPILWTAPAGSGKTYLGMSLALSVAGGLSSWLGTFPIQVHGTVLHLNLEMPADEVARRYQRLARAMRLNLGQLPIRVSNRLHVPQGFSLTSDDAVNVLAVALAGVRLCVIDSLRAFIGGMDENKSEVRLCLDVLLSVSERTGTTFIVIHHEGKPPKDGPAGGSSQHRARGSSAIVDACDCTFSIGAANFPCGMRVEQGKASMGEKAEPFFVKLVDSGEKDEDGRSTGIAVEYVHAEEADEYGEQEPPVVRRAREAILDALGKHGSMNVRAITKGKNTQGKPIVRGRVQAKEEAIEALLADGLVVSSRVGTEKRLSLP